MTRKKRRHLPTMSKSALVLSGCTRWLEKTSDWYDESIGSHQKRDQGTAFHSAMDTYHKTGVMVLTGDPEVDRRLTAAQKWWDEVFVPNHTDIQTEVAYRVDLVNLEAEVVHAPDRGYGDEPNMLYGTADIVARDKSNAIVVADWKTGSDYGAEHQLKSLSWAALQLAQNASSGHEWAHVVVGSSIVVLDGVPEGVVNQSVKFTCRRPELLGHIQSIRKGLSAGVLATVPGIHCTQLYCPHLAFCPETTKATEELAEGPQGHIKGHGRRSDYCLTDPPVDAAHAAYIMERVAASKRQVQYLTDLMKKYVEDGGTVSAGGLTWGPGKDGYRWRKS